MTVKQQGLIAAKQHKSQAEKKQPARMQDYVTMYSKAIEKALPTVITPDRFIRMVQTALTSTPKLQSCTPESFIGAMLNAAQLGVEPNTPLGQAYLIPYGNKAQFQLGFRGMIQLARRSGEIKSIGAREVYQNDKFMLTYDPEPKLIHERATGERGPVVRYYAYYTTKDGGGDVEEMTVEEAQAFANKYSKSAKDGPWVTDFDAMCKKTVLKRVLKYAPVSAEMQTAISYDEHSINMTVAEDIATLAPVYEAELNVVDTPESENGPDIQEQAQDASKTK